MTSHTQLLTADQLRHLTGNTHYKLVDGHLQKTTSTGCHHGAIANAIAFFLTSHVRDRRLGTVIAAETGFILQRDSDTVRVPDVAFISSQRLAKSLEGFFPGPPDLAVKIVSPTDRLQAVHAKPEAWLKAGAGMLWVIRPKTRSVSLHRGQVAAATLRDGDELDGAGVVPGFRCAVSDVFDF